MPTDQVKLALKQWLATADRVSAVTAAEPINLEAFQEAQQEFQVALTAYNGALKAAGFPGLHLPQQD